MAKNKKKRNKLQRAAEAKPPTPNNFPVEWDEAGVHAWRPGKPPPARFFKRWTENFQQELKNSPIWQKMVEEFGQQKAEELLKQCQIKPGEEI